MSSAKFWSTCELETLRAENSHLREEVQLLKSIVINLDRKVTQNQNDIIDFKSRSMKHNILIHNLAEEDGENLFIIIPALIKEHLGIDTKFSNIHRNGWGVVMCYLLTIVYIHVHYFFHVPFFLFALCYLFFLILALYGMLLCWSYVLFTSHCLCKRT